MFRKIKNYFFLKKYPFMKWYGDPLYSDYPQRKTYSLSFTWYDEIPEGWRKAFGKKMMEEIKQAGSKYLKEHKDKTWKDILFWEQIKEKYGELCLYALTIDEIGDILEKYQTLSIGYCIDCGKPARYRTSGWIEYYCEECFEKEDCWGYKDGKKVPLTEKDKKEWKQKHKLNKNNIPKLYTYDYNVLNTEVFKTENEARDRFEDLWNKYDAKEESADIIYHIEKDKDSNWLVNTEERIETVIDIKEKYDIDFEEIWGLKK